MINGRRFVSAVIGGLLITAVGYADLSPRLASRDAEAGMVPTPQPGTGRGPSPVVGSPSSLLFTNSPSLFNSHSVADLASGPFQFLPEKNPAASQASESQHPQALTEGTSSLSLCLSALMGLGLCGSVHWVKRLHFGAIPEWYHDGGPFQIGHTHAVMPNSLFAAPVCCFIQPVCQVEDALPLYRLGTIISLWRKSQFTPAVVASRAPPLRSC